jgi:hypothetical protein
VSQPLEQQCDYSKGSSKHKPLQPPRLGVLMLVHEKGVAVP